MYLTSSLEPTGSKSTHHYLILNFNDQRELVRTPTCRPIVQDLKKEVLQFFHIPDGQFHVETKELNICVGKAIRIPEGVWSDIAELLGNVYVVPRAFDAHPESHPEPGRQPTLTTPHDTSEPLDAKSLRDTLYEQILACNPIDAASTTTALEILRHRIKSNNPFPGIKWQGTTLPHEDYANIGWIPKKRTICIVRFTIPKQVSGDFGIIFGLPDYGYSLWATIDEGMKVDFRGDDYDVYHTVKLEISVFAPGEHSVAFINDGENLLLVVDFRQAAILPKIAHTTLVTREPKDLITARILNGEGRMTSLEADVYEFL